MEGRGENNLEEIKNKNLRESEQVTLQEVLDRLRVLERLRVIESLKIFVK